MQLRTAFVIGSMLGLLACGGSDLDADEADATAASGSVFTGDGNLKITARWKGKTKPKIEATVSRGSKSFTAPCTLTGYLPNYGDVLDTRISCALGEKWEDALGFEIARERKGKSIKYSLVNVALWESTYEKQYEILRGKKASEDDVGLFEPKLTAKVGKDPNKAPMALGVVIEKALAPIEGEELGDDDTVRGVDYKMTPELALDVSLGLGGDSELNLAEAIPLRKSGEFLEADAIRELVLEQAHGGGPGGDLVALQKAILDAYGNDELTPIDASDLPAAAEAVYSDAADDPDLMVFAYSVDVDEQGRFFIVDVQNEGGMDVYVFDEDGECVLSGWAGESSSLTFSGSGCALPD